MSPLEVNARKLIGVLVQHFPSGGTCEDFRRAFEKDTGLKRQMFYNTLKYTKQRGWIVGGGSKHNQNQLYNLNPDGSWKEPESIGDGGIGDDLDKDRQIGELQSEVERLLDWSGDSDGNGKGVGLSSLVRIVGDSAASTRQRLKAAAAVLGYKTEGDIAQFVKKYLTSVCESTDAAIDYKIEAGELLRRHEAPRIAPETVRPVYREVEPVEKPEPLMELVARRKARQERREREREALRQAGLPLPAVQRDPD